MTNDIMIFILALLSSASLVMMQTNTEFVSFTNGYKRQLLSIYDQQTSSIQVEINRKIIDKISN